jgi:alpha-glucosidase
MTDGTARELTLDLSFLGDGRWTMATWADGPNAARNAMDYVRDTRGVTKGERVTIRMAPGGGFVAKLTRGGL